MSKVSLMLILNRLIWMRNLKIKGIRFYLAFLSRLWNQQIIIPATQFLRLLSDLTINSHLHYMRCQVLCKEKVKKILITQYVEILQRTLNLKSLSFVHRWKPLSKKIESIILKWVREWIPMRQRNDWWTSNSRWWWNSRNRYYIAIMNLKINSKTWRGKTNRCGMNSKI